MCTVGIGGVYYMVCTVQMWGEVVKIIQFGFWFYFNSIIESNGLVLKFESFFFVFWGNVGTTWCDQIRDIMGFGDWGPNSKV